jgi:hypothetical protein
MGKQIFFYLFDFRGISANVGPYMHKRQLKTCKDYRNGSVLLFSLHKRIQYKIKDRR